MYISSYLGLAPCKEKNGMEYSTLVNFFFSVSRVSTVIDIHFKNLSKIKEEEKKAPRGQVKQLKQQIDIMHYNFIFANMHTIVILYILDF